MSLPSSQSLLNTSETSSRRCSRVVPSAEQPIRVDINGDGFIDVLEATDISPGGLGVMVPHGFKGCNLNSLVSLIIQLPFPVNKHIKAIGKVIHLNEKNFGISFVNMSRGEEDRIQAYIDFQSGVHQTWLQRFSHWITD